MNSLLMAMCEPSLKEHHYPVIGQWHHWLPGPAATFAGPMCKALGADMPWPQVLLASLPLWMPVLCACAVAVLWRAQFGTARYLTPPGLGFRRMWIACSALYAVFSVWQSYTPRGTFHQLVSVLTGVYWPARASAEESQSSGAVHETVADSDTRCSTRVSDTLCEDDLREFQQRVERQPGERFWQIMCEKTTADVYYVAWRHILPDGGTEYFSRTVVEDADPDAMIAFYNHDERRLKWDGLLVDASVLDVDRESGTECVWWKRNLPCCGFRDYVFGRRTWKEGEERYTVSKGATHPRKPRGGNGVIRVDPYYSSWRIRPVASRNGHGKTAVETILIHYEEMRIQHDVARFAVRQGMWGVVKNLIKGYRQFHNDVLEDPILLDPSYERVAIAPEEREKDPSTTRVQGRQVVMKALGVGVRIVGTVLLLNLVHRYHNRKYGGKRQRKNMRSERFALEWQ